QELMKMQASLAFERNGNVEGDHEEAFASAHASPHIDSARNVRPLEKFSQSTRACQLVQHPVVIKRLQAVYCSLLRLVRLVTSFLESLAIVLTNIHETRNL